MSEPDQTSVRPYVPPEPSPSPEPESSSAPRLIPLAPAIRQRHASEQPVDSPLDPHDLFGIFYPIDEETTSEPTSELAAAIIPGPFLNNVTTLDTGAKDEPVTPAADDAPSDAPSNTRPTEEKFRPMLEVDRLVWPIVCHLLHENASEEIDCLVDALVDAMHHGQTAIGMAGCRSGEGSTTLLLSAVRRLGDRKLKVAIVDAHFTCPEFAERLRLFPETGWEDVLADRSPLVEVAIESVEDRLTIVPLCGPIGRAETDAEVEGDQPSAVETRMLETIDTLADHYDLVLVDVGPLDDLTALGGVLVGRLDAIVLVHNPSITTERQLAETQRHLADVQVPQTGIVCNFVRAQAAACG